MMNKFWPATAWSIGSNGGESEGTTAWNITDKIPVVDAKGAIIGTAGITRAARPASSLEATAPGFGPALAHMRAHFHHEMTNRHLASISNMSLRAFEQQFMPPSISPRKGFCESFGCALRVAP